MEINTFTKPSNPTNFSDLEDDSTAPPTPYADTRDTVQRKLNRCILQQLERAPVSSLVAVQVATGEPFGVPISKTLMV